MDDKMTEDSQFPEAELARLADGSLPTARQDELHAELQRSPALTRALAEQQQAISLVRSVDVRAPDSLRRWLEEQTQEQQQRARPKRRRSWLRPRIAFPAIGVAVAAVAAAVVIAVGAGSSGPTLDQATGAALAASTMPAPTESGATTLDVSAGGIQFPYWGHTVGWQAEGARVDSLAGRHVVTVFYRDMDGSSRVGYTIVTGEPVHVNGGAIVTSHGIPFTLRRAGSARSISWVRNGHTCVIAGRGVTYATLLKLATADVPA
jgi:hypothetical protein